MKYKSIIFDLDGTLLDTIEDLADAANKTLGILGFPSHPVEKYNYFIGGGVKKLMERALPEGKRDAETLQKAVEIQQKTYAEHWNKKTKPYLGILELLAEVKQRRITMSILSNKPDDFTKLCVSELLPINFFEIVRGGMEGIPLKPDPASALDISEKLKISPRETIYVGDTDVDIKTALGAGMFAVGVLWGFRQKEELLQAGANKIISSPEELLEIL